MIGIRKNPARSHLRMVHDPDCLGDELQGDLARYLAAVRTYGTTSPKLVAVAEHILAELGTMSAMKLQRLCYYSQAWHLAWDGEKLFEDEVHAWANGPVVVSLYALHVGSFTLAPGQIQLASIAQHSKARVSWDSTEGAWRWQVPDFAASLGSQDAAIPALQGWCYALDEACEEARLMLHLSTREALEVLHERALSKAGAEQQS